MSSDLISTFLGRRLPSRAVQVGVLNSGFQGLTEMVDFAVVQKLHVSNIFHKSFIEVNQEGTEAATRRCDWSCMFCSLLVFNPLECLLNIHLERPFRFSIHEKRSTVPSSMTARKLKA
ncbi:serpin-Z2B-like [Durio zibethinus]|uniref:Serpin-Z2B-like n=1 Tax=Durio zibethinus TaxID=66656 RepID=A0A6P5ZDT8_DURZI|nr:serpin-Z2B-like [Durio zibethinus]